MAFVSGQYFTVIHRGPKPRANMNMFIVKSIVEDDYIELNMERGIYSLTEDVWECLKSIYGSMLTLRRGRTKEVHAYYLTEKRIEVELNIKNQHELNSLRFPKLCDRLSMKMGKRESLPHSLKETTESIGLNSQLKRRFGSTNNDSKDKSCYEGRT